MFLRFEIEEKNKRLGTHIGIFTLAYELSRDQELEHYQRQKIQELLDYFEKELPVPNKFWELKIILEDYGHLIKVTKSSFVGRIVYMDEYQVVVV